MEPADNSLDKGYEEIAGDSSLESPATLPVINEKEYAPKRTSVFRLNKTAFAITIATVVVIAVLGIGVLIVSALHSNVEKKQAKNSAEPTTNYSVGSNLSLQGVSGLQQLQVSSSDHLTINGQLKVTNTVVLSPTAAPTSPVTGQIYYDQTTNQPYYYNGASFVSLSPTAIPQSVTSLGGTSGALGLGDSLSIVGNTLGLSSNLLQAISSAGVTTPKVTSIQGLTGDVSFSGGTGIAINGTTITNTGVTSIGSSDGSVVITSNGNGGYNLQTASGGPGSQSVTLGPISAQNDSTDFSSIRINKTGAGYLLQLGSNGTDTFIVNQQGQITTGTISYSQVQGAPASIVSSIGGVAGDILVGDGLGLTGSTLSNTGVVSISGTNNQVIASAASGSLTLSLPQDIGTTSSPIFGGETLNGDLTVSTGGATSLGGDLTVAGLTGFNGSVVINGGNGLTTGTGPVTFGILSAGVVRSDNTGSLSAGVVDRNNSTYFTNALSVTNGGTGVGTFATDGILFGNGSNSLQVTNSAANSILATDASSAPGLTQTLPTAVQSNITGTGSLTSGSIGGGFGTITTNNTISTTGALQGGSFSVAAGAFTVDSSGNVTTTGKASVQGSLGLSLGVAGTTAGSLVFANVSNSNFTTLQGLAPTGQSQTIMIPATNASNGIDQVCLLSLGNCVGAGGAVTSTTGTLNYITKYTNSGGTQIGNSLLYDNGVSVGVGTVVPGASYKLDINGNVNTSGSFSQTGSGSFTTGTGAVTLNGPTSIPGASTLTVGTGAVTFGGTLGVTGLATLSGGATIAGATITNGVTVTGTANINATGGAATNIGTNTADFSLASNGLTVTTAGALSGITTLDASGALTAATSGNTLNGLVVSAGGLTGVTGITSSGSYTQSGSGANTLTGATTIQNNLSVQGASLTLGLAGTTGGNLTFANSGNTNLVTLQALNASGTGTATLQLPSIAGGSTDIICLQTLGNCGASSNSVTTSSPGTVNTLSKFTGANAIANSGITDDGTTVTINGEILSATTITANLLQSTGALTITPGGKLTIGATSQMLALQGNSSSTFSVGSGASSTTVGFVTPTAIRNINFPDESGTVCLENSNNCGFAGGGTGVISLDTIAGNLTLNNSSNTSSSVITIDNASTSVKGIAQFTSANFSANNGLIDTIQGISTTSSVQFGSLLLGTGSLTVAPGGSVITNALTANTSDLTISAGANNIIFSNANGTNTFLFPTTGGTGQVICTSGISCASGGGQAVILEPSAVQTANTNQTAIFVNKASGIGNLIDLQAGGTDAFVIDNTGNTTISNTTTINALKTNSITPTAGLTIGATSQAFTLQGSGNSVISGLTGGKTTTVGFGIKSGNGAPTGDVTYLFENDSNVAPNTPSTPYFICTTAGNCSGVGGSVTTSGGSAGTIAKFTAGGNIENSIITDNGTTAAINGNLAVGTSGGSQLSIGLAGASDGTLVFNNSTNSNSVTIQEAGAPTSPITLKLPTQAGTFAVAATGALSLDPITGVLSCPSCLTGGGGSGGGVSTITGSAAGSSAINGALSINNAFTTGTAITINSAKADGTTLGIATFNSANFSDNGSGVINTKQDISTTASPTFANLIVQGSTGLTLGSASNLGQLVYKDGTSDGFTNTLSQATLTGNRTVTVPNASGTLAVSASGNLSLSGLGNLSITQSPNFTTSVTTPLVTSAGALTITSTGALNVGTTGQSLTLQGNGATTLSATSGGFTTTVGFVTPTAARSIVFPDQGGTVCLTTNNCLGGSGGANAALSNLSNVALNTTLLPGAAGSVDLGSNSLAFGKVYLSGTSTTPATNNFVITGVSTGGSRTITLPDASGTVCLQNSTSCGFETSGGTDFIQNTPSQQTNANFNIQARSGSVAATIEGASGQDIIDFANSSNVTVAKIDSTGSLVIGGNISVTGSGTFTTGSGTVKLGSLGAGIVQSDGTGTLSSGAADRNSSTLFSNVLNVANGGTGANTFTSKGILYGNTNGALQVTAAVANGVLVTDGTSTPLVSQVLPTAVQGNITTTGALVGGSIGGSFGSITTGSAITTSVALQSGSLKVGSAQQFQVSSTGAITTTGTASIQGAGGITLGVAGTTAGSLVFANGSNGNSTTIQATAPSGQNQTISIPATNAAGGTDTVCLVSLANCGGSSGNTNYIENQLAQQTSANFNIQARANSVAAVIQGASGQDIIDLVNSSNTTIAKIDSAGNLTAVGGTFTGNIAQSGSTTFTTGTGAVTLNGNTSVSGTSTLTVGSGASILGGTLQVAGLATLNAGATISGGNTSIQGSLVTIGTNAGTNVNIGSLGSGTGATDIEGYGGIKIGSAATGAGGSQSITIGNNFSSSSIILGQSTIGGSIQIGSGAITAGNTQTINIGSPFTQSGVDVVTIGNPASSSSVSIQAGTGGLSLLTQGGTLNIGNNSVAQTITIGNTTGATSLTLQAGSGGIILGSISAPGTSASYLCRNALNQIATCSGTATGTAFVQGGNSFGTTGSIGTNDFNSLAFRTNNATRLTLDTSGNLSFASSAIIGTASNTGANITIQGGSSAQPDGSTSGNVSIIGGSDVTFDGNVGGNVIVHGGSSGGSAGGNTIIDGGLGSSPGNVLIGEGLNGGATLGIYLGSNSGTNIYAHGIATFTQTNAGASAVSIVGAASAFSSVTTIQGGSSPGVGAHLLDFKNNAGVVVSSFSNTGQLQLGSLTATGPAGQLTFTDGSGGGLGITVKTSGSILSNATVNIPYSTGLSNNNIDTVCLLNLGNCFGNGSGITGTGTQNYVPYFDTVGASHLTASLLYNNGFVGVNTTSNNGELSVVSTNTAEGGLFVQNSTSSTVPVAVLRGGVAPGSNSDLLQLQTSAGTVVAKFNNAGQLTLGNLTGSVAGKIILADGSSNGLSITLQTNTISSQSKILTIPGNFTGASDTVCLLSLQNCTGGSVSSVGATAGLLAKFNNSAGNQIANSSIYDGGGCTTLNGFTCGATLQLYNTSGNTATSLNIQGATSGSNPTISVTQGYTNATGDLLDFKNGFTTILTSFNSNGNLVFNGSSPYAAINTTNNALYLQPANNIVYVSSSNGIIATLNGTLTVGYFNSVAVGSSANSNTVTVGGGTTSGNTQTINIGVNTASSITNVTIGSTQASGASNTLVLQASGITQTLSSSKSVMTAAGATSTFSGAGQTIVTSTNSATAFQVQNSSSANVLTADTLNNRVVIGSLGTTTGQVYVSGRAPTVAGGTNTGNSPLSLAVSGRYAFVVNYSSDTLTSYDVSNPTSAPLLMGTTSTTGGNPLRITVVGHYAYVVTNNSPTLTIYDISNPKSMFLVGSLNIGGTTANGIFVSGRYAYLTMYSTNTLDIVDISNPFVPVLAGSTSTALSGPDTVYVQGRYAYVGDYIGSPYANDLTIFDVSNPAVPAFVSVTSVGAAPQDVKVQGSYAYIAAYSGSFVIMNISDPSNPFVAGSLAAGGADAVSVQGRYAYLTGSGLLETIDISNPAAPALVASLAVTTPQDVKVQGRYAYTVGATTPGQLRTYDLGGEYTQQLEAGGTETGTLQVDGNEAIAGDSSIQGAVQIGQSLQVSGNIGTSGSVLIASISANAFAVQNASGYNALNVSTTTGITTLGNITTTAGHAVAGKLTLADGTTDGFGITLQTNTISTQSKILTIPGNFTAASDTLCLLTLNNCASTTALTSTGATQNYIAKFNNVGGTQLTNSLLYDSGSFVGVNTTNGSAELAVVASSSAQRGLFVQGGGNTNVPVAIFQAQGAGTGDLLDLNTSGGIAAASFNATGGLTFNQIGATTPQITVGAPTTANTDGRGFNILGGSANGTGNGGALTVTAGTASGANKTGGALSLSGGSGSTYGGAVNISGGSSVNGGNVVIQGGGNDSSATPIAGTLYLEGGYDSSTNGVGGGAVNIFGGSSSNGASGNVNIFAGTLNLNSNITTSSNFNGVANTVFRGGVTINEDDNEFGGTTALLVMGNYNGNNPNPAFQVQNTVGNLNLLTVGGLNFAGVKIGGSNAPLLVANTATTNLLVNPGFENGATWNNMYGGATGTIDNAHVYEGTSSLQITTPALAGAGIGTGTGGTNNGFNAAVPAGTYTVSFYVEVSSGTVAGNLFEAISHENGGGTHTCIGSAATTITTAGFQRLTCTLTATATLGGISINQVDATARTFYIDAIQLEAGSSSTPYQTGTLQLNGLINSPETFQSSSNSTNAFQILNASGATILGIDTLNSQLTSGLPDGASAIGFKLDVTNTYSSAGGKLLSVQNNGNEKFAIDSYGHIITADGGVTAPTTTVNADLGTGGSCTVAAGSSDTAGTITLLAGTSPSAGQECTITFNETYSAQPHVFLTPTSGPGASIGAYVPGLGNNSIFAISVVGTPTASVYYTYNYLVVQ